MPDTPLLSREDVAEYAGQYFIGSAGRDVIAAYTRMTAP